MAWPWNKNAPPAEGPPPPPGGDLALEVLASLVRTYGRTAFDVSEMPAARLQKLADAWAQHLTVLGPHPERPDDETARRARDWGALRRFFGDHRKREQAFVAKTVAGLREAVWVFVRGLDELLRSEAATDADVAEQLEHLKEMADSAPPEQLKFEVLRTTREIARIQEERRVRQHHSTEAFVKQVRALAEELQEARREGNLDPLTELYNQKAFDEQLRRVGSLEAVSGQAAVLLVIGADGYKETLDTRGGTAADAVLQDVAELIGRTFIGKHDFLARLGGDTFAVLLPDTRMSETRPVVQRFLAALRTARTKRDGTATVSVGAAELGRESAEGWYMRAQRAMGAAREEGGDRLVEAKPPGAPPVLTLVR